MRCDAWLRRRTAGLAAAFDVSARMAVALPVNMNASVATMERALSREFPQMPEHGGGNQQAQVVTSRDYAHIAHRGHLCSHFQAVCQSRQVGQQWVFEEAPSFPLIQNSWGQYSGGHWAIHQSLLIVNFAATVEDLIRLQYLHHKTDRYKPKDEWNIISNVGGKWEFNHRGSHTTYARNLSP